MPSAAPGRFPSVRSGGVGGMGYPGTRHRSLRPTRRRSRGQGSVDLCTRHGSTASPAGIGIQAGDRPRDLRPALPRGGNAIGTQTTTALAIRSWLPFMSRHGCRVVVRLSGGRSGKWLFRRAGVRGEAGRAGCRVVPECPPGLAFSSRRWSASMQRKTTLDSCRLSKRIASIEVFPPLLRASK